MQNKIRYLVKSLLRRANIRIQRIDTEQFGYSIEEDVERILRLKSYSSYPLTMVDAGANIGQSIDFFIQTFPKARIIAFEPSPKTFATLIQRVGSYRQVTAVNQGLGSQPGTISFYENSQSEIGSFLRPTEKLWGAPGPVEQLELTTLDSYVDTHQIPHIHFLKIDTQGFDLEVLKGADKLLRNRQIDLLQLEITISQLYENLPRMDDILRFLMDFDYRLVAFYGFHSKGIEASWTDALFIRPDFIKMTASITK